MPTRPLLDLFLALFDQRIEARIEAVERVFGGGAGSSDRTRRPASAQRLRLAVAAASSVK